MAELHDPFVILEQNGTSDYIGEPVTQIEHMRQAARLAQKAGADDALILGALFHDIGHLCAPKDAPEMDGLGVVDHEHIGADFLLACGYSERVAALVRLHVQAKRYLCFRHPSYAANLSPASAGTLRHQGGMMTADEAAAFEEHPLHRDILRLRAWDEAAKEMAGEGLDLHEARTIAVRHYTTERTERSSC